MGRSAVELALTEAERTELSSLVSRRNTAQALALRARIVLACADGTQNKEVAARLALDAATVSKWRRRFAEHRLQGLRDDPRPGAPRTVSIADAVTLYAHRRPGVVVDWKSDVAAATEMVAG